MECDDTFNTLLRDTKLHLEDSALLCKYVQYLSTDSAYRMEYARFVTEREQYKIYHNDAREFISMYNQIVIKWRFK